LIAALLFFNAVAYILPHLFQNAMLPLEPVVVFSFLKNPELCFMPTLHLWITGKVQGVFYRATAAEKANELKLNGWIRNTTDGAVEATISGSEEAVDQFVAWCRQGPKNAQVANVAITLKPDDGLTGFQVF
jgi:acylphosphatase